MNIIKTTLAASVIATLSTPLLAQSEPTCPRDGLGAPLALHEEWIMEAWERREGDPAFESIEPLFWRRLHP